MRVVMFAPPGGGKGTHSTLLSRATGVGHLSSGVHLRAEIERGTGLGQRLAGYLSRGDLVPDGLMFELMTPVIVAAARDTGGFILDGFPRTVPQAFRAARLGVERDLVLDAAIYLTAPRRALVERMLDRAQVEGRTDDTPEVIEHRLDVFVKQTAALVEYYESRGILLTVDTDRPQEDVQADIQGRLAAAGILPGPVVME